MIALFRRMCLRNKFLLCFVFIILLNTVGIGAFSYFRFSAILLENAGEYAAQILKQSGLLIANTYRNAKTISTLLTFDETVQQTLSRAPALDGMPVGERRKLLASLENVMVNHFDYVMMRSIMISDTRKKYAAMYSLTIELSGISGGTESLNPCWKKPPRRMAGWSGSTMFSGTAQ